MALAQDEIDMLAEIKSDSFFDDSNLRPAEQRIARKLYRKGLIGGTPIEGSDAAIDHLFLTDVGNLALSWYGPTSDDDAVVDWFALLMKAKLRERSTDADKGPLEWRNSGNVHQLFERFMMEVGELAEALFRQQSLEDIIVEAVDCGNTVMMLVDAIRFQVGKADDEAG